jgi:hypothetical protein
VYYNEIKAQVILSGRFKQSIELACQSGVWMMMGVFFKTLGEAPKSTKLRKLFSDWPAPFAESPELGPNVNLIVL